jgi:eukaryotic-like serine/threonine-protein kinase
MSLTANFRLGPYEIKSMLGAGGMGEVYRARDSRLNRDVAIKVLRDEGASSPERRSRFEREARAVAALNHPNIVAVYDFGIEGDKQFIVSELVEGESLRSLVYKPLPVRKLVEIAAQVADGLAAAHAARIVHRDLKPENIMVGKDGRVKILDFGLSRQGSPARWAGTGSDPEETFAPDVDATRNLTEEGTVIGTASYMSPEQATGRAVDYRPDQFSLGLVLHGMATGKQTFARSSRVETMAAIVRDEPPGIDQKVPAPLRWIIDRCLQKEPEQRYESTRDLFQDLKNLREHLSESFTSGAFTPVATRTKTRRWGLAALYVGSVLLVGSMAYVFRPTAQNLGHYRYTPFASDAYGAVWSPDSKAIAYGGRIDGTDQVFVRSLNSPVAIQLTHEKNDVGLVGWSSDGSHLVVASYDPDRNPLDVPAKLSLVATFGGELQHIMDAECLSCALSPDGKAFATLRRDKDRSYGVWISDPFGNPLKQYLPSPFTSKNNFGQPQLAFSPNGRKLLLSHSGDVDRPEIWLLPYPSGSGFPRQILRGVASFRAPDFAWLTDSLHIVISLQSGPPSSGHLWIADTESGNLEPLTNGTHLEIEPAVSPDGGSLVYTEHIKRFDIASVSVEDGSVRTLTMTAHEEHKPAWAARQSKLTWVSERSGFPEIWMRNLDGTDRPVVTRQDFPAGTTSAFTNPALSPDGDRLIYGRIDNAGIIELWVSSLAGGSPVRLTNNPPAIGEYGSNWSPDGKDFAYLQTHADKADLMTVKTSGNASPEVLRGNIDWYFLPDWSPTGEWITFHDDEGAELISPNGKNLRSLGKLQTLYLAFSKDGKKLYGIKFDQGTISLFSVDPNTVKTKVIKVLGQEWAPNDDLLPAVRFSFAPDGKTFVYAISKTQDDLWMLQGYRQPGWFSRFSGALVR